MNEENKDQIQTNEDGEVVGTENPRNDMRAEIARQAEAQKLESGEFDGLDLTDEDQSQTNENDKPIPSEEDKTQQQVEEPKKFKLKVNGKELELTEAELIERAQKVEAADQYLAQAKARAAEARQPAQQDPIPHQEATQEDLRALARAIQMGTEEEAEQALQTLVARQTPSIKPEDMARTIDQQIQFRKQADAFAEAHKDIFDDPYLDAAAGQEYHLLRQEDEFKDLPHFELMAVAAQNVRKWRDGMKKTSASATTTEDKLQRKASVTTLPSASARQTPPQEEDGEENPHAVIARMARSRGQI